MSRPVVMPGSGAEKSEPVGPYTVTLCIQVAMQRLTLLEWALHSRLDSIEEIEVFTTPLADVKRELEDLCAEIERRDVAPASYWQTSSEPKAAAE